GLKYSDGKAITPNDFKYGWQRLCDPATAGDYAFTGYIVVGCEAWNSMDAKKDDPAKIAAAKTTFLNSIKVSGNDISFTLTDPAPYFNAIASIWVGAPAREDMVTKGGDKWTEPSTFIGNGPFILSEWKHNEKMVFTRNPNYRNPAKLAKPSTSFISEGLPGFDGSDTFQKYDVTAAKAALAQATPAAQAALSAVKLTYNSNARNKTRLEWFQNQWKTNLGVNITLDPVESTTYTQ